MFRRVFINLLLAFILFPAIILLFECFRRYILLDYSGFTGDFWGLVEVTWSNAIRGMSWWMFLGVLLPYNTIIYYYKELKEKDIPFPFKVFIFCFIILFTLMLFGAPFYFSISFLTTLKIILYFIVMSLIIVTFHYYFIEKKGK